MGIARYCLRLDALGIVCLGLFGFFVSPYFVTDGEVAALKADPASAAHGQALLWLFWIGVQGSFWALSLVWIFVLWRGAVSLSRPSWSQIVLRVAVPLVIVLVSMELMAERWRLGGWPPEMLGDFPIRNLPAFSRIGSYIAVLAVAGMLYVGAAARRSRPKKDMLNHHLKLQRSLDGFLLIAALILGMGVVGLAVLRDAARAANSAVQLDQAYVILFGGVYSVVLAIAYVVARIGVTSEGRRIEDSLTGASPTEASELKGFAESRDTLTRLLRLKLGGLPALGEAFSVLIPLLVGLVSSLLEGGKSAG